MQGKNPGNMELNIRRPAASGTFYPNDKIDLEEVLEKFFKNVTQSDKRVPKAIIVPHAGYVYSGQVAAYAYKYLKGYKRVILLGPSHHVYLTDVVTDTHKYWETPLGILDVVKCSFEKNEKAHLEEHCLEVQIPFLQFILKKLEIIPLVVGDVDIKSTSERIQKVLDDDTLLVISSDLSHYRDYETAKKLDKATIDTIKNLDETGFIDACGEVPIRVMIDMAKAKNWKPEVLEYKNSGDTTGEKSWVVGYVSIGFYV